jgi:uncharacterized protein (TIGR03083 family)
MPTAPCEGAVDPNVITHDRCEGARPVPTLAPSPRCHAVSGPVALDLLGLEIARIAQVTAQTDPATLVPACPGWDLADLVRHLGTVHRMVGKLVATLSPIPLEPRSVDLELPPSAADRGAWFTAGGSRLVETLRAADPAAPVYTFGQDRHVRFWIRRMLHETTMHRVDAEQAAGLASEIDPGVALDMIDEFLDLLAASAARRQHLRELQGDGETLHLHATDAPGGEDAAERGEWLITLEPDGFRWSHAHVKGAAAVRGTTADLAMFVYGRRSAQSPQLDVSGDHSLLAYWSAKSRL